MYIPTLDVSRESYVEFSEEIRNLAADIKTPEEFSEVFLWVRAQDIAEASAARPHESDPDLMLRLTQFAIDLWWEVLVIYERTARRHNLCVAENERGGMCFSGGDVRSRKKASNSVIVRIAYWMRDVGQKMLTGK